MFRLDGKKAAVTGAKGLLGSQFCKVLAEYGAEVIPLDLADGFNVFHGTLPKCDILVQVARTFWQGMEAMAMQHKGSVIINIASIYGVVAPDENIYRDTEITSAGASYTADKHAVIGLTKHLAVTMPDKRVNCISPGGIEDGHGEQFKANYSKRVPMGRMARPDEMNGALIFLASDASSYMTGQNLVIDGGLISW